MPMWIWFAVSEESPFMSPTRSIVKSHAQPPASFHRGLSKRLTVAEWASTDLKNMQEQCASAGKRANNMNLLDNGLESLAQFW